MIVRHADNKIHLPMLTLFSPKINMSTETGNLKRTILCAPSFPARCECEITHQNTSGKLAHRTSFGRKQSHAQISPQQRRFDQLLHPPSTPACRIAVAASSHRQNLQAARWPSHPRTDACNAVIFHSLSQIPARPLPVRQPSSTPSCREWRRGLASEAQVRSNTRGSLSISEIG